MSPRKITHNLKSQSVFKIGSVIALRNSSNELGYNFDEPMQKSQLISQHSIGKVLHNDNEVIPLQKRSDKLKARELTPKQTKLQRDQSNLSVSKKSSMYIKSLEWDNEDWVIRNKVYHDEFDVSDHPLYTIKNIDYSLECYLHYMKSKVKYNAQLCREMQCLIDQKPKISDEFFTRRLFTYATLWPPLHTKAELNLFTSTFFQLPPKHKKRLNSLMSTDIR